MAMQTFQAASAVMDLSAATRGQIQSKRYGLRPKRAPLSSIGNKSSEGTSNKAVKHSADAFAHYRTNDADDMSVEFSSTTAVVERPEGVPDIDADNTDDPQMVTDYAKQIHTFMLQLEARSQPDKDYMQSQTGINIKMRGVLVDWLVEVHLRFDLLPETMFLTTLLLDRYLSKAQVSKSKLQLVGVTAMLIASKYEEMWPPEIADFVYMTDKAYSKRQVIEMELSMLQTLDFSLGNPLPTQFLQRYSKGVEACESTVNIASYAMELSQASYNMIKYKPSILAASSIVLAREVVGVMTWSESLQFYSGYTADQLEGCIEGLKDVLKKSAASEAPFRAIHKKHSKAKFMATSQRRDLQQFIASL